MSARDKRFSRNVYRLANRASAIGMRQAERTAGLRPGMPEQADGPSVEVSRYDDWETPMDITTLLLIILIVLVIGGGGWYGRGRWY